MKHYLHNSLRSLFLSLAVLLSLPMLAVEVEIGGINYDLDLEVKQATVVSKSGRYSGEVVIPESVEHEGAAYSVTSIGEWAFCLCQEGLISVTIGNSVKSIGDYAFLGCFGLTSVTIGNSVTSIGDQAFSECYGLSSVTIPNSVKSIGKAAFSHCYGLTSIVVEDGNPVYDSRNNCNAIVETASNSLICGCNTSIIPNSVTSIGNYAFDGCSGLTSVTIPNSVTSIGNLAFLSCSGLTSIVVEDGNPVYDSRNNCNAIIETATNTLHSGCKTTIIPNSVTNIGELAFYGCSGLTSVTIPNSVTSIGEGAFSDCSGLTSIVVEDGNPVYDSRNNCNAIIETATNTLHSGCKTTIIPNSVTSIGDEAFSHCSGLTSVTIPNSVTSIGQRAFAYCFKLLDVYCYAENVPATESDAFESSSIQNATLHVPAASVERYKSSAPWSEFGKIVGLSREYDLTVSSVGYATLYLDFNTEIPESVEAYIAKEVVDRRLKMERVEGVLPANTGVIILADEGTYAFIESNETPAVIEKNLLKGTVEKTEITAEANTSYYVLSAPDGVVGMYLAKLTENKFWNNANKAYLPISYGDLGIYDEEVDTGTEQLSRKFVFDFGDETGIDELKGENGREKSAVYDLSGRRVQKAQKGIFIQNGKVMIK